MRSQHVDILVGALERALGERLESADDFASTAATGELLRRAALAEEAEDAETTTLLSRYDAALAGADVPTGTGLTAMLDEALEGASAYATESRRERDPETGVDALRLIDETLSVAAAAHRIGRLDASDVDALSRDAWRRVRQMAPRLSELWTYALEREADIAPDPDLPMLYAFWEPLAELAPDRLAFELALEGYRPAAEREALKERLLETLTSAEKARRPSLFERLREALDGWSERLRVALARPVPIEAFDSGIATLPTPIQTLVEIEGLAVLWEYDALVVEVPEGHEVRVTGAIISDGEPVDIEQEAPNTARVELGPERIGVTVELQLSLDGEPLGLPPIDLEEAQ